MRKSAPMVLFLAVVVLGCASSGTTRAPRNPNLITLQELEELPAGTAYDAVQRLRPNWLRSRSATVGRSGRGEVNLPAVFADDVYFGPIDSLGRFGIEAIEVIEFLSARDATTHFGTGYPGGVIHLRLRKGFETRP